MQRQADALEPARVYRVFRQVIDGATEVVGYVYELGYDALVGALPRVVQILSGALLVVLQVRRRAEHGVAELVFLSLRLLQARLKVFDSIWGVRFGLHPLLESRAFVGLLVFGHLIRSSVC